MTSRRQFLQGLSTISAIACTGQKNGDTGIEPIAVRREEPVKWSPNAEVSTTLFPSGVQVGDVTAEQGFVSVQTTLEKVVWVLVVQSAMEWQEVQRGIVEAIEGTLQFALTELKADSAYCLACFNESETQCSSVSRFRSGLADDLRLLTFGASSCMGGNRPWQSLTRAAEDQLDFFLMLGDTVYTNARSYTTAWADWKSALRVQGFQDLSQSTSIIATWDDHEIG